MMEFQNVSLAAPVGLSHILKNISFTLTPGMFIGLVGPSGAGKSSLMRLMNRLTDPSEGNILWRGQNIQQLPVLDLRQQVCLVPQESKLLGMTVREAMAYPLQLRGIAPETANAKVEDCLDDLGIPSAWLNSTEVQLSVGQRQRVAISRSLILNPPLLLLDEPTSSQDIGYGKFLMEYILNTFIQKSSPSNHQNRIVVMANHQLELVEPFATHVLHLQDGKLISFQDRQSVNWSELRRHIENFEQADNEDWGET